MASESRPRCVLRVLQSVDPALPVGLQVTVPPSGGVVGRTAAADICFPGSTVSREHARFEFDGGAWFIVPLTTTNAVFIDGAPVSERTELVPGATAQFGGVVVAFVMDAGTTPVLVPLDEPVLLEVHNDGGACTVFAGRDLVPMPPAPARVLHALAQSPGKPVHRWDLLEVLGPGANLDKTINTLRSCLRDALQSGLLDPDAIQGLLDEPCPPTDLPKRLVVTRRGHGYLLAMPPHRIRAIDV